jgi:hypothetical protein
MERRIVLPLASDTTETHRGHCLRVLVTPSNDAYECGAFGDRLKWDGFAVSTMRHPDCLASEAKGAES